MKKIVFGFITSGLFMMLFFGLSSSFQSCKKPDPAVPDTSVVYKPNIYIYPESKINLKVKISFPKGGKIIASIPAYDSCWKVDVEPTGLINGKYDYLFYESQQPDEWQLLTGWIIARDSLSAFFKNNMNAYGFNQKEIKDFIDFWIPKFNGYKYYLIYPQEKVIIDKLIQINFSIKPDNYLRLFYVIKGTNELISVNKHIINTSFNRKKLYIAEWGVIIK